MDTLDMRPFSVRHNIKMFFFQILMLYGFFFFQRKGNNNTSFCDCPLRIGWEVVFGICNVSAATLRGLLRNRSVGWHLAIKLAEWPKAEVGKFSNNVEPVLSDFASHSVHYQGEFRIAFCLRRTHWLPAIVRSVVDRKTK